MKRYDVVHSLQFTGSVTEIYDIAIIPDTIKSRILPDNDTRIINNYVF